MEKKNLTVKQYEFLEGFKRLANEHNLFSPSLRELQRELGYRSVSTAAAHADALVAKGYLQKEENTARSLRLVTAETGASLSEKDKHLEWLRSEISRRKSNPELAEEVKTLQAALALLDQTDET